MRGRVPRLAIALIITIIAVEWIWLAEGSVLRLPFAMLLVLVLPGYGLMWVLFPKKTQINAESLLYVPGLSLVVTVFSGFVLNFLPWGLQAETWAIWLGTIAFVSCIIGFFRTGPYEYESTPSQKGPTLLQTVLFSMAVLIVIGSTVLVIYPKLRPIAELVQF